MKAIDWRRLLTEHRVPFAESGPNVKRGELAIQCPFCGSADPSKHMGLNLETGWWSCWRNRQQHSGKSPIRLLMKLLRLPYGAAREAAGLDSTFVDPEGFDAIAARVLGRSIAGTHEFDQSRRFLEMPGREIKPTGSTKFCFNYLIDRGFFHPGYGSPFVADNYGLLAGEHGTVWQDRVLLPYFLDGELVTWTARAIAPSRIRYRDLEVEDCLVPPKQTLYNHDAMYSGGKALVIQEGPFDVLKVDFYGKPYHIRSVGLSTNSVSEEQIFLLQAAVGKFERIVVMLDTKKRLGIVDSMRLKQQLRFLGQVTILPVPFGAGDGGNMTFEEVREFALSL